MAGPIAGMAHGRERHAMKLLRGIAFGAAVAASACGGRGPIVRVPEEGAVTLPIEVLGPSGAEKTVTFRLAAPLVPRARTLGMRVHGIDRPGKASLQVNAGAELPIANGRVAVAEPGKSFGGVGGGFATLAIEVPLAPGALVPGENTLRFRSKPAAGSLSPGYRILSFNVLDESKKPLLEGRGFKHEEPRLWLPPSPSGIAEGARLWSETPLALFGNLRCADCHTHDGRDLAYYGYSNAAIIAKAELMGLTEGQATAIASYVRSIPVTPWGRPWNPPYQPGPELDLRPLASWAAGAGVDAALARDHEALPFLFRTGVNAEAVATSGRLNLRELPIVLQLPDWNHWLPPQHPAQIWGARFTQHPAFTRYLGIRERLIQSGKDYARGAMPADLEAWAAAWNSDFVNEVTAGLDAWPPDLAGALYAGVRWRVVKAWELMHEFELEDIGADLYAPRGEPRTWFSRTGFAANTSPSRSHVFDPQHADPWLLNRYFESAWRHLGVILNPGNRRRYAFTPFSYRDAIGDLHLLHERSGVPELSRFLAIMVKGMQEMDNGFGPSTPQEGWSLDDVVQISTLVAPSFEPLWAGTSTQDRASLTEALLRAWWSTHSRFALQEWPRGPRSPALPPPSYRPTMDSPSHSAVDALFTALPRLREVGVDPGLLDQIRAWGMAMWPNGAW